MIRFPTCFIIYFSPGCWCHLINSSEHSVLTLTWEEEHRELNWCRFKWPLVSIHAYLTLNTKTKENNKSPKNALNFKSRHTNTHIHWDIMTVQQHMERWSDAETHTWDMQVSSEKQFKTLRHCQLKKKKKKLPYSLWLSCAGQDNTQISPIHELANHFDQLLLF